ncbi:MAG: hypothetical protein ACOX9E_07000 [Lentisphaeria bacterium]|jgi:hypothetical protein
MATTVHPCFATSSAAALPERLRLPFFHPQISQILADYFLRGWLFGEGWAGAFALFYPQISQISADFFGGGCLARRRLVHLPFSSADFADSRRLFFERWLFSEGWAGAFALFYPQILQISADFFGGGCLARGGLVRLPFSSADFADSRRLFFLVGCLAGRAAAFAFFYPQIPQILADSWRHVLPLRGNPRRRFFADWGRFSQSMAAAPPDPTADLTDPPDHAARSVRSA